MEGGLARKVTGLKWRRGGQEYAMYFGIVAFVARKYYPDEHRLSPTIPVRDIKPGQRL